MKIILNQKDISNILLKHLSETFKISGVDILNSDFNDKYGLEINGLSFYVELKDEE